jgi:hypothetical protein
VRLGEVIRPDFPADRLTYYRIMEPSGFVLHIIARRIAMTFS